MKPDFQEQYDPDEDEDLLPSKSQIKRDMHALLDLGRDIIALSTDRLKQLPISERLFDAVRDAQRANSREGKRRAAAYVGKLMRDAPADAIRTQLDTWANGSREETRAMHKLEDLRDRLLADDEVLTQLLVTAPALDVQALRAQIRAARKEVQANTHLNPGQEPQRKNYRALFQTLKALQTAGVVAK